MKTKKIFAIIFIMIFLAPLVFAEYKVKVNTFMDDNLEDVVTGARTRAEGDRAAIEAIDRLKTAITDPAARSGIVNTYIRLSDADALTLNRVLTGDLCRCALTTDIAAARDVANAVTYQTPTGETTTPPTQITQTTPPPATGGGASFTTGSVRPTNNEDCGCSSCSIST